MAINIRLSKLMKFAIEVAQDQAKKRHFYSPAFKDSDYLNFIVTEWLEQNYTQDELFDLGYDQIFDDDL